ncbi:MAG: hypothetical protein ABSG67_16915 [Thermoguttaceae bacterium]|jgi:N-ethylmaleimide reductase
MNQQAALGLIITEATAVSHQSTDCPITPGIYTDKQVAGWQRVIEVAHHAGGRIFLQLWRHGPDIGTRERNRSRIPI